MLLPKRVKYRRPHRGSMKGTSKGGTEVTFGEYGYEDDGNNTCGGLMLSFTAFGK
jgi:ribosomal protein L16/L10AE